MHGKFIFSCMKIRFTHFAKDTLDSARWAFSGNLANVKYTPNALH